VGSIIERKNLLGIVKAIQLIKDQTDIHLVVVGKGMEYQEKVKQYTANNNLESRIIFTSEI
jgi:glycosyltransferase involved in cell wall biosynthesis